MIKLNPARSFLKASIVGVSAAALLSGCMTLEPKYVRPALPAPATLPQGGVYPPAQAATVAAPDLPWRDFFVDPKLRAVIAEALANNRDLRASILTVAEARAQYRIQRAALAPHVNAAANATYEQEPAALLGETAGVPSAGGAQAADQSIFVRYYTATLGVSNYEVDLWGRVRSLTKQALEQYLATDSARLAAQISLISQVATSYVTYAADYERLDIAKATVKSDDETVRLTQARFNEGVSSELDLRQAQTALEEARGDVITYTTTLAQDLNGLTLLAGAPVSPDLLPGPMGDDLATLADIPAGLSSDILLRRPDILEAEHQLKAYNANIGAARAAFFPTIALTGGGGSSSLSLSQLFGPGTGSWSFTPSVTLPIFDAGANAANLRYAKAERDVAVAQYEKAIQTAFREVADALAQRGQMQDLIASRQRLTYATGRSLTQARARYTRGSDTYLNTLTAEVTAYSARQAMVTAQLTRAANLITLYQTLGGGVR
jgi:multidrug efflux system outer membrane protein